MARTGKKNSIPSDYPKLDMPKATGERRRGQGAYGIVNKNGQREYADTMVNAHKPIEQLKSYKEWTRVKGLKRTLIAHYSECGSLIIACNLTNIHPSTVKQWLVHDEEFREDYDVATDMAVAILEHEARRRALEGSDRLLEFLLKSLKPEVYRERYEVKQEVSGDYIIDLSPPNGLSAAESETASTHQLNDTTMEVLE
jgi:hypothetical protein